jgi:hypothetical protein
MGRREKAERMDSRLARQAQAGHVSYANATSHRGSKPGFAHRPRPPRPLYAETTEGVPPRAKLHRPLEQALPMRDDVRRAGYQRQNGSAALTGAQVRRARKKLVTQTIRPQRQVTPAAREVPLLPAGPGRPAIGSLSWAKRALKAVRPKSRPPETRSPVRKI